YRRQGPRQVELEALDRRDETAERDQPRRPRPPSAEAERVRHHRALGEPPEDSSLRWHPGLLREGREELAGKPVARFKGLAVREADLAEDEPVGAGGVRV